MKRTLKKMFHSNPSDPSANEKDKNLSQGEG